jgi:hypothetical protein
MVYYTSKDTMLFQNPTVADFTTTSNDFVDVYTWMTHFCSSKRLKFEASNLPLVVKVLVSNDGGATFEDPTFTNTYTITPGTPIETNIDDFYSALKIQVKPLYDNQPGTLSTHIAGSSIPNASSGGSGGGDANSANQTTQIAAEQGILAKLIAAPATEAKQNTIISLMGGGGQTYRGQYRTTTTGASESITIPSGSTQAQVFAAKDSEAYLDINAASTAISPIHTNEFTLVSLNLGGVTSLTAWVTTGNIGVVFYG